MKINLDMFLLLIELVLQLLLLMIRIMDMLLIFWHIMIFVDMDLLNRVLWFQILKIVYIKRLLLLILLKELNIWIQLFYVLWLQLNYLLILLVLLLLYLTMLHLILLLCLVFYYLLMLLQIRLSFMIFHVLLIYNLEVQDLIMKPLLWIIMNMDNNNNNNNDIYFHSPHTGFIFSVPKNLSSSSGIIIISLSSWGSNYIKF